jgi:ABC-type branched-subunit amino acid transport system substrate-binding protein
MPDELTQEQTNKLMDFRRSWLQAADDDNPDDFESSNNKMGKIVNAIRGKWSGLEPDFLLEPILQILLERQFDLQNDNLETIQQKLIKSLSLKKSQDDNFNNKLEEYLKTNAVNAKTHPLLSVFLPTPQTPPTPLTPLTPLRLYIVVGLGAVICVLLGMLILYILMRLGLIEGLVQPQPTSLSNSPSKSDILALCDEQTYQGLAKVHISCNDTTKFTSNNGDKNASNLIASNNDKILKDLKSKSGLLKAENVYPLAAVIPLTAEPGARDAGERMLSGIAKKQDDFNKNPVQKLLIVIADDKHDANVSQQIAENLGKKSQILGVIGPYSSSRFYYAYKTYKDNQLTVVSPSVSVAMADFQDTKKPLKCLNGKVKGINPETFFRTVEDTTASIKTTLDYLKNRKPSVTKLIVFVQYGDLYTCSLFRRLRSQIDEDKTSKYYKKFSIYKKAITVDGKSNSLMKNTNDLIKDKVLNQENTAILYFQGAFTDKNDSDSSPIKLSDVIKANDGHFLFIGSSPVRQSKDLKKFLKIKPNYSKKILIMQPWVPSLDQQAKIQQHESFWKPYFTDSDPDSDNVITWHYAMAYDATQMFLYAINQFVDNNRKYPTRQGINDILAGKTVQNPNCNKNVEGITGDTFTGNITLNGSDRCPPGDNNGGALIQFDPNLEQWKKAD